jgi:hypothetical protein
MTQHVGQNFTHQVKLNVLPGISLQRGTWQVNLTYVTYDQVTHITNYNSMTYMSDGRDLEVVVGSDVRDITFQIHRVAGIFTSVPTDSIYQYSMRIDRLILLNLAYKFLKNKL